MPVSHNVVVIDPNQTFRAVRRSVLIDVGYFLELQRVQDDINRGKYILNPNWEK